MWPIKDDPCPLCRAPDDEVDDDPDHDSHDDERYDDIVAERDLWKAEAERWRQMYMEYDEMLEGQVREAVERLSQIWEDLDELKRKVENDMLDD